MSLPVAGAEGFTGWYVVEELVCDGFSVSEFGMCSLCNSLSWLEKTEFWNALELNIICGDARDSGSLQRALDGHDVVIRLASLIAVPYSYQAARSYIETNDLGTLNGLESCRRADVFCLVHTSTSDVYGTAH